MAPRTVLVTGATGLLGREVVAAFRLRGEWNVKGTGYSRADGVDILKVDLESGADIAKIIDEIRYVLLLLHFAASYSRHKDTYANEILLNGRQTAGGSSLYELKCPLLSGDTVVEHLVRIADIFSLSLGAAQRFPDKVDKDPEAARALNITGSKSLASVTAARDILLIYISTDYVFPGRPGDAPYEADAAPAPTNLYGQTKLDGEKAVLEEYSVAGKEGLGVILRVPVLYGHAETPSESAVNVLMDSVWKAQTEGTKIKMDHWAIRYPTNTGDIGRICHDVATKYLDSGNRKDLPQTLQFSSEDKMTKYEICQVFGDIMGLSIANIEPNTEGNDPNASVQRPYDCHLSTRELKNLGIDVSTSDFVSWWRREVRAFRK
ncbi:dtdp-4-dehydrorhamnose reductase [Trichoderma arundinaceum]|uniref:Dtdp-4-dehydrorhamnose reductase n=1 Tax=Trichoderma arundinaceum TaxID=490622 RepID=A0A395NHB0_TRIAR|nr:dtdp-4-dehydrorhamnose reductase [Trichoderma arundinaceum]